MNERIPIIDVFGSVVAWLVTPAAIAGESALFFLFGIGCICLQCYVVCPGLPFLIAFFILGALAAGFHRSERAGLAIISAIFAGFSALLSVGVSVIYVVMIVSETDIVDRILAAIELLVKRFLAAV